MARTELRGMLAGAALLAGTCLTPAGLAGTWTDIDALKEAISKTGTTIAEERCSDETTQAFYEFEKDKIDQITICINNIDKDDPDEYWEALAHEATHVMQACTGDYAIDDKYISRIYRELQSVNPTSVSDIQAYGSWDKRQEIEARWMEFQQPGDVIDLLISNCSE